MFKLCNKTFSHNKVNTLMKDFNRSFMTSYKVDFNHWISYENGISMIGCTSVGQEYYKNITDFHCFVGVGQSINIQDALFGIETGYFKDFPIMKYFKSPIVGVIEEINAKVKKDPISLIQLSELDAWLIKIRVEQNNIENYFSLLRELDFNK
jgi:glycine cleavage system H lipoate-binding protein